MGYFNLSESKAPISPKTLGSNLSKLLFCLGSYLSDKLKFSYWEGSNLSAFYNFFKWPFLTFKCQNFGKSYQINVKDEIIIDPNPEVYTFK